MPQQASSTQPDSPETPIAAGLLRRFAALGYDSLLLMAIALAYGALATLINVLIQGAPPQGEKITWNGWQPLVFIGLVTVLAGFYCYFWQRRGQTLGMRAWRLKLVSENLETPGLKQCVIRALVAPFSLAVFGLGYFWALSNPERQTLHGQLSRTRVVLLPKKEE